MLIDHPDMDLDPGAFAPRPGQRSAGRLFKKNNNVPPPDPRLVEAQIKSLGVQDEMIQKIIEQSERFAPLQEQQMRQAIDTQSLAAQQAQEDRGWMLGRRSELTGVQDALISEANNFNTAQRQSALQSQAQADVNTAFDTAQGQQARALSRMGVNPNSGRASAANTDLTAQRALALATATNKTREAARQEGFNMKSQVMNALAGYPSMGMQATAAGAGYGLQGLTAATQGLQGLNSGYAQAMGGATNMTNSATQAYNGQLDAYVRGEQIANSGGGFGDILGGIGAVVGAIPWSDRRLKTDIIPVGRDARTGLALYEFRYKDDPQQRRYRGVMADEVLKVMPRAVHTDRHGFMSVDYGMLGIRFEEVRHAA